MGYALAGGAVGAIATVAILALLTRQRLEARASAIYDEGREAEAYLALLGRRARREVEEYAQAYASARAETLTREAIASAARREAARTLGDYGLTADRMARIGRLYHRWIG